MSVGGVDTGGLNYRIEATDAFSATTDSFRLAIAAIQNDLANLTRTLAGLSSLQLPNIGAGATVNAYTNSLNTATTTTNNYARAAAAGAAATNSFTASMERFLAKVALFLVIKEVTAGIKAVVEEMIHFNSFVEQSTKGIGALFLAVGQVRDASGNIAAPMRGFEIATQEARRQIGLLRQDTLQTTATFEQLVHTYQISVAPGLGAGFSPDQIRKFTLSVSQAAQSIELPQDQLAAQIRAILTGTIQQRTTRLASALLLTNADIKRAKESGDLFGFLEVRLKAFNLAQEATADNFERVVARIKTAIQVLLGEGGKGFFDATKTGLKQFLGQLVDTDPITKEFTPKPELLAAVKSLGDSFIRIIAVIREGGAAVGLSDISSAVVGIGKALEVIAEIVVGIGVGLVKAGGDISNVVNGIRSGLASLGLIDVNASLLETVATLTRLYVDFYVFRTALTAVRGIVLTMGGPITLISVALAGALEYTRRWVSEITGVDVKFSTLFGMIQTGFESVWGGVYISFMKMWNRLIADADIKLTTLTSKAALSVRDAFASALGKKTYREELEAQRDQAIKDMAGGTLTPERQRAAANFIQSRNDQIQNADRNGLTVVAADHINKITKALKQENDALDQQQRILDASSQKKFDAILANNNTSTWSKTLSDTIANFPVLATGLNSVQGVFGTFTTSATAAGAAVAKTDEKARNFGEFLRDMPGLVSSTDLTLESMAKAVEHLGNELAQAQEHLTAGLDELDLGARGTGATKKTGGLLSGNDAAMQKASFQAAEDFRKTDAAFLADINAQEQQINGILKQRAALDASALEFDKAHAGLLAQAADLLNRTQAQNAVLEDAKTAAGIAQQERIKAYKDGDKVAEAAALDRYNAALKQLALEQQESDKLVAEGQAIARNAQLTKEQQTELERLTQARANSNVQEIAARDRIKSDVEQQSLLEGKVNEILNVRLTLLAKQQAFADKRAADLKEINVKGQEGIVNADKSYFGRDANVALATSQANLANLEATHDANRQDRLKAEEAIQERITAAEIEKFRLEEQDPTEENTKQIAAAETNLNSLLELQTQKKRLNKAASDEEFLAWEKATADVTQKTREAGQDIQAVFNGIADGIKKSANTLPTAYQEAMALTMEAVRTFGDTVAGIIVDSFDPTKKVDIKQRFADMLAALSKQMLSWAIQKLILLPFAALSGGGEVGGGMGFAGGGDIPDTPARWRPLGLPASDTVNAWLTPGEHVIRRSSALLYGREVMESINRGLVDPTSLRALAGVRASRAASHSLGTASRSYAAGGMVQPSAQTATASSAGTVVLPVVVARENEMEKMLAGGKGAMLEFLRANRGAF